LQYRKEIDGLRAIAVLPVIFFHADLFGVTGGYIGVDIFFVISGYLITSIILDETKQNNFSIIKFYERRARRILPALSIVLLVTTIAAFVLMPAFLLESYSKSLLSVATFSSNIFFYLTSGYFSTASDEKPLLHTWSLAVEEQYYIFFPVLISTLWFLGKRNLLVLIVILSIASLVLCQYLSMKEAIDANFYLIFSRAWELFFGSVIAFIGVQKLRLNKLTNEFLGVLGIGLIIYATFHFNRDTPFPSFYTLVPVIGTVLIIAYSDSTTLVGKALSNKAFVSIGLLSYSLYLWHQPLFSFLRMKTVGKPEEITFIYALALTFLLSYLSYKYIEKPFRNKNKISRKTIFKFSTASITIFISAAFTGMLFNGFENRFEHIPYLETAKYSPKRSECHTSGEDYLRPDMACRYFGKNITWATFGDSHTVEPAFALAKLLEHHDQGIVHLSFSGCSPALLFDVKRPGCSQWIKESLAYLESDKSIENVLLGFRYSSFLFGSQLGLYPDLPNRNPAFRLTESSRRQLKGDVREAYWESFNEIVQRLLTSGKNVYIQYPIPELPVHIIKAASPFSVFGGEKMLNLKQSISSEYYFSRNRYILNKLDTLPYGDNLYAVKPYDILCDSQYCPAVSNGKALYFDDDHLSVAGAIHLLAGSVITDKLEIENSSVRTVDK
jgi:peptidoglycan/LPS O-acetylase OafA/YrhL